MIIRNIVFHCTLVLIALWFLPRHAFAETPGIDSLEYPRFAARLEAVFEPSKIRSLVSKLPVQRKIYGYDVGDFTNDDRDDLVISAGNGKPGDKSVSILFFENVLDTFNLLKTIETRYFNEPIEIAFTIDQGVCYVTQKKDPFHWTISGYHVRDRIFKMMDRWEAVRIQERGRLSNIGFDTHRHFSTLRTEEHFYRFSDTREYVKNSFLSLPVYRMEQRIPAYVPSVLHDTSAGWILTGSSSWFGRDDLSFRIEARYDSSDLHMNITVEDDRIFHVTDSCEGDILELWFDVSGLPKVREHGAAPLIRDTGSSDVFSIIIPVSFGAYPGNSMLLDITRLKTKSKETARLIRCTSENHGMSPFSSHVRIPLELFQECLESERGAGFAAVYRDRDNSSRPDWITVMATSEKFVPGDPSTFGSLHFIPQKEYYGEIDNMNTDPIIAVMKFSGLLP